MLDSMPTSEGNAMSLNEFYDITDELKKTTANGVVQQLLAEDLIKRTGSGVRGSPYRYWRKNIHSSASKIHVTKERIFDVASDGVQLEMDSFGTSILSANE